MTQKRLKEVLRYDKETGEFIRIGKGKRKVGSKSVRNYIQIGIDGKNYRAHRLAWLYVTGELPNKVVDHINGKTNDNSWNNLRMVTQQKNTTNCKLSVNNTSNFNGVGFRKDRNKWRAYIMVNRKTISLGMFDNYEDAVKARKNADEKFGYTNGKRK